VIFGLLEALPGGSEAEAAWNSGLAFMKLFLEGFK
jgi:hypothetical protein